MRRVLRGGNAMMTIPFYRYHRPHGRKTTETILVRDAVGTKANILLQQGYSFTMEHIPLDDRVCLTVEGWDEDLVNEVVANKPELVMEAVERLVNRAVEAAGKVSNHRGDCECPECGGTDQQEPREDRSTMTINTTNKFMVGSQGDSIIFMNGVPWRISREDALLLAAYLVSMAEPFVKGPKFAEVLKAVQST